MRCRLLQSVVACALAASCGGTGLGHQDIVQQRTGAKLLPPSKAPLRTRGRYIIDITGERVKWACINWYGAYSTTHVVGGLEKQPLQDIAARIVDLGFNCVRMMYSTQGYVHNPEVDETLLAANPSLKGKRFLELFDLTVQALTDVGLMVIVNNHISKSGWCCHYSQDEGLWYTPEYSEEQWIESLVFFAERYRNNTLVVGIDLRNEVHDYEDTALTWGDGNMKTDWAAAATRAGNRVLQASPDVIIVVMALCFGADLRPMKRHPVQLMYPHRVVYQTHNYLEYQIFENISKMLRPWKEIRNWVVLILVFLCMVLLFIRFFWIQLGKPKPPLSTLLISIGLWVGFFASVAAGIATGMYSFATRFCKVGADADFQPWVNGTVGIAVVAYVTAVAGIFLLLRAWRSAQIRQKEDGDIYEQVDPVMIGNPVAAGGAAATSPAGALHGATALEGSSGMAPCASGFKSVGLFWKSVRSKEDSREWQGNVKWDIGLCCVLQVGIVVAFWSVLMVWLYIFAHMIPTYWWMERHLDSMWGFALEEDRNWTAPVWMGEFGQEIRGHYWLNFVRYLSHRDVDFAYWALNGLKWAEGEIDGASGNFITYEFPEWMNETFSVLEEDYRTVRMPWRLLDLQALMDSPARWTPDSDPCDYDISPSCGG